jgi:tetratricopeptide (TPR) repeat protein
MHRLSLRAVTLWLAVAALVPSLLGACGPAETLRDQAEVERLRNRIAKVRYAIDETRSVIAQSRGAPYMDELYMRLAELQSEEAQYHYMVAQRRENATGAVHAPQVRFLKEESIAIYERILSENPDSELGDRILFNIAHEHRELGNFEEMIATLQRLIANEAYRGSRYRDEALLVLGDYYFDRNEMRDAGNYYGQILQGPDSPLHSLAQYKLGWVYINDGDCKLALKHFEDGIDSARVWAEKAAQMEQKAAMARLEAERAGIAITGAPTREEAEAEQFAGHKAVDVRREALIDLIYCYSTERPAKEIITYLRERSYNRGAYIAALEKAAARYGVMEEAAGGALVARELLRLAPDDEDRLDDARMLHAAITRAQDYSQVGSDVSLILRAMRRRSTLPGMTEKARNRLKGEFEVLARDLSTKAQAQADEDASPEKALEAAKAYRVYLLSLPDSEHRLPMTANLADSLALAGDWLAAGRHYREVAEATTDDTERNESNFESVAAYQKVLQSDQPRTHLERVEARAGLRKAGLAFLKTSPPPDKSVKIRFAVAQTYYDEGRYRKAIDLLTAVAYEYPNTVESEAAINLVLDSYNTLNDYDGLITAGRMFLSSASPAGAELQAKIRPIVESAEGRRLEEISLDAAGDSAGSTKRLEAFAERYKGTDLGLQALLRDFDAARAEGNVERMYARSDQISREYSKCEELPGILATVGRTAAARFEFEKALEFYERSGQVNPEERDALSLAAGQLREELADYSGAAQSYKQAMRGDQTAQGYRDAAVRLADLYERQGDVRQIISLLSPMAATNDPEILSRLGLAELRSGSSDAALEHLDQALAGSASDAASGRAQYAQAEQALASLTHFRPQPTIEGVQELLDLVDQVESLYLGVVQQGESIYTFAAFGRVAKAYAIGSGLMAGIRVTGLSGDEATQIQEAISSRAEQLKRQSDEALGACAERVLQLHRFDKASRACLAGRPPEQDPAFLEPLEKRRPAKLSGVEELRSKLAANAEDVESLQALGSQYLKAGDFHVARMILAHAVEAGGGPELLNMLGLAAAQAGDWPGALEAFSRAGAGGFPAAQKNFAAGLKQVGLAERAAEAQKNVGAGAVSPADLLPTAR